jgi:hypothetical protein
MIGITGNVRERSPARARIWSGARAALGTQSEAHRTSLQHMQTKNNITAAMFPVLPRIWFHAFSNADPRTLIIRVLVNPLPAASAR